MRIVSLLGKLLASIMAAFGAAAVARKYTEPPEGLTAAPGTAQPATPAAMDGGDDTAATQQRRLRLGWSRPKPEKIPEPTYWPATLALGIAFIMWGIISNIFVFGMGLILFVTGMAGWIGDLLHEFE
jgi:hypothetical protein